MGSCQHSNKAALSLTIDLTSILPHSPPQSLSLDPSSSLLSLFTLLDLPKTTPPCCFQLCFRGHIVSVSHKSLEMCGVQSGDVVKVVSRKSGEMVQVEVGVENSKARFSLWVKRKASVRSLLETVGRTLRLPPEELRLVSGSIEIPEVSTFETLSDCADLRIRLLRQPQVPLSPGLTLELTCENSSCQLYLQRQTHVLGLGSFELGASSEKSLCKECALPGCLVEGMKFRACGVKYDGVKTEGGEESGWQGFGSVSGELFQGARVKWRKLRLVVSL